MSVCESCRSQKESANCHICAHTGSQTYALNVEMKNHIINQSSLFPDQHVQK